MAKAVAYGEQGTDAFKISRSKLEDHVQCPRCFVLDRKFRVAAPSGPSFTLNSAVDAQLKNEFDALRETAEPHAFVTESGLNMIPLKHAEIDDWRKPTRGLRYIHPETNFEVYGALDDIWVDADLNWVVVDYKTTAKDSPVQELSDAVYHQAYGRQLDVYAWLLERMGHPVAEYGYFFFATARKNDESFGLSLNFDYSLIKHEIDTDWVVPQLLKMKADLDSSSLPDASEGCEMCAFVAKRAAVEK